MTALDVKFSLAISSRLDHCLVCAQTQSTTRYTGCPGWFPKKAGRAGESEVH